MRFCNLIPPFLMRFGTIPESYKLAMTYEEQLLWLCKYLEDMGTEIENIKTAINNIGVAINALADNIEDINNDITDITQNHYLINILRDFISIDDFADNNVSGYYYTNVYRILKGDLEHLTEIAIPEDTLFFYDSENKYFKILSNSDDIFSQYILYDALTETWEYGEYRYVDYVGESSTSKQIPSAEAVYTAIQQGGGGGGTTDYTELSNKPAINGVTLSGDLSTSDLHIDSIPTLDEDFNVWELDSGIYKIVKDVVMTYGTNTLPDENITIQNDLAYLFVGKNSSSLVNFTMIDKESSLVEVNPAIFQGRSEIVDSSTVNGYIYQTLSPNTPFEFTFNRVNYINEYSIDTKYPTAKAVYDYVQSEIGTITTTLQNINTGNGV